MVEQQSLKKTCIKDKEKGGSTTSLSNGLHAETRCRKVYEGKVFE